MLQPLLSFASNHICCRHQQSAQQASPLNGNPGSILQRFLSLLISMCASSSRSDYMPPELSHSLSGNFHQQIGERPLTLPPSLDSERMRGKVWRRSNPPVHTPSSHGASQFQLSSVARMCESFLYKKHSEAGSTNSICESLQCRLASSFYSCSTNSEGKGRFANFRNASCIWNMFCTSAPLGTAAAAQSPAACDTCKSTSVQTKEGEKEQNCRWNKGFKKYFRIVLF